MKDRIKRFFSISVSDLKHFNDTSDKIEVAKCPRKKKMCDEHLRAINESYVESNNYLLNKNFLKSIESLKEAFYLTEELKDSSCVKCVKVFRSTITQSVEDIYDELRKTSTGMFKTKRYQPIYKEAGGILRELRGMSSHKETKRVFPKFKEVG